MSVGFVIRDTTASEAERENTYSQNGDGRPRLFVTFWSQKVRGMGEASCCRLDILRLYVAEEVREKERAICYKKAGFAILIRTAKRNFTPTTTPRILSTLLAYNGSEGVNVYAQTYQMRRCGDDRQRCGDLFGV